MGPIEEGHEYRVVIRLLDQNPPFDRHIVEALLGGPKKNRELRPWLGRRNVNVLIKASRRLRDEGIIRTCLTSDLHERTYSLARLGTLVVFGLHEMVRYHRSQAAVARGRRAASA